MEMTVWIAILTMGGLGLFFAAILAFADTKFHVQENPLLVKVTDALPHANCGVCGRASCLDFAMHVMEGQVPITGCPLGGAELADKLATILDMEVEHHQPKVARLMCRGDNQAALSKPALYYGPQSCALQSLASGGRLLCFEGCLGGGDCARACPVGAISMSAGGLPFINAGLCTGCGLCVNTCPRLIIELHPREREIFVLCKNRDDPLTARQVCAAACNACGVCARFSDGAIKMIHNLAVIDYQQLDPQQAPLERCKSGSLTRLRD